VSIAVYDSKEPIEFWLSKSTTIMGFITWTEHLCNPIVDDAFYPSNPVEIAKDNTKEPIKKVSFFVVLSHFYPKLGTSFSYAPWVQ